MTRYEAVDILDKAVAYTGTFDLFTTEQRAAMANRLSEALELTRHVDVLTLDRRRANEVLHALVMAQRAYEDWCLDEMSTEDRAQSAWEDEQLDRLYGGNSW